jgi:hypothetical protein
MTARFDHPLDRNFLRIAKLQWCHDLACNIAGHLSLHVKVEYDIVKIANSSAIAISYTWGSFDRADVIIGHDAAGNVIRVNLGSEWEVQETINTLVELCLDNGERQGPQHAAVWMDQLCTKQDDANDIRETLASIPDIYRALEVVILMPGSRCRCLERYLPRTMDQGSKSWMDEVCLNAWGICSYFDRVWTRQELSYSRTVRIVRTSNEELACVRKEPDKAGLSRYLQLYLRHNAKGKNWDSQVLFTTEGKFRLSSGAEIVGFECKRTKLGSMESLSTGTAAFLMGETLFRPQTPENTRRDLGSFVQNLFVLAFSNRGATKARDYVLSVWVDCPGYKIPEGYRCMDLPSLLQDAVWQLQANHFVTVSVGWIPGFQSETPRRSALWSASSYLGRRPIKTARDVYGVVNSMSLLPLGLNYKLPLSLSSGNYCEPLGAAARPYSSHFFGQSPRSVWEEMKGIVMSWPTNLYSRSMDTVYHGKTKDDGDVASDFKYTLVSQHVGTYDLASRVSNASGRSFDFGVDHAKVAYEMVTAAIGLNARYCRNAGMTLVIIPGKYLGLTTRKHTRSPRDSITIRMTPKEDKDSVAVPVLLEASITEYGQLNTYGITGIWIANQNDNFAHTAIVRTKGVTEALLE